MSDESAAGDPPTERDDEDEYRISDFGSVVEAILHAVTAGSDTPSIPRETPVSTANDREPLPPLYDTIEPEALATLAVGSSPATDLRVTFSYFGHEVTVTSANTVTARERSSAPSSRTRGKAFGED
jgi:hypothetical protein